MNLFKSYRIKTRKSMMDYTGFLDHKVRMGQLLFDFAS